MRGYWKEFEPDARCKTIKLLLNAGANPRAKNTKTLMTCIHWSAFHTQDLNSLQALREQLDIEEIFLLDYAGMTPLDIAGIKAKNDHSFLTLDYLLECAEEYFNKHIKDPGKVMKLSIHPESELNESLAIIKGKLKAYSEEEKLYMEMLYWASYRDKTKFALKLIRAGMSPFVDFVLNESAIVAAIKGGSYNTVKAIIDLNYQLYNGEAYNIRNSRRLSL